MKEKKKVLIIGVLLLLVIGIGATFAYFQSVNGNTAIANINATTGTTDILTFSQDDIDVSTIEGNQNKVKDEELDTENPDIVIHATESNFGKNGINLGDGVKAKATLRANNTTNETKEQSYNVFLVLDKNTMIYTQGEDRPELIMRVTDPEGNEVTNIMGLTYHKAEEDEPNDISGFDITNRTGSYAIKRGQTIKVEAGQAEHVTEQEWQIEIILINLNKDQNGNTGPEHAVNGKILITAEDMPTYELAHISSLESYTVTNNSISGTLNFAGGTSDIKEYWYKLENLGTNKIMTTSLVDDNGFTLSETGATFTFTGLEQNTKYRLYSYVVDVRGFKSDIYETDIELATDKLPIIKMATVSEVKYNSFKVTIDEVEEGSNGIDHYTYHITGGTIDVTQESSEKYYEFTDLKENIEYSVEITAYDEKGQASPVYDFNKQTTTTDKLPVISKVEATTVEAYRLIFTITTTLGNNKITNYSCSLKQGAVAKGNVDGVTSGDTSTATCEFTGLDPETAYSVEVIATDEHGNKSVPGTATGTTAKLTIGLVCVGKTAACFAENANLEDTLIYHNLAAATQAGIENANLVAEDDSYRYTGINNVNNYICLDGKTTGACGEEDLYRIIGLFKNGNNYEMKVIKSTPANTDQLGKNGAYFNYDVIQKFAKYPYYWNSKDGIDSSNNNWNESNLKETNLNINFKNYIEGIIGTNKIIEHTWIVGGNNHFNITSAENVKIAYQNEIKQPATTATAYAKIGLMYVSDYYYAGDQKYWLDISSYDGLAKNFNWIFMNNAQGEWTIMPDTSFIEYPGAPASAYEIGSLGGVSNPLFIAEGGENDAVSNVRPVFYLNSSVTLAGGNGTLDTPYRIS